MAGKRKKVVLTIQQKLELIDKFEKGESVPKLASEYGIGTQTVRDIKNNKAKLIEFVSKTYHVNGMGSSKRKSMKTSTYKNLDDEMLCWFHQKQTAGTPVTGPMFVRQAKIFHESLGLEGDFNASSGWLTRFKERYGIRGDRQNTSTTYSELQKIFTRENLTPEQIYNATEMGLYWKSLPNPTLCSEERITIMCCANAAGNHKLKLLVIGEETNPEFNEETFQVVYYDHNEALMDREIFQNWFHMKFVPDVRLFLKSKGLPLVAILLLDNVPSHPSEDTLISGDGLIYAKYFPSSVTSSIQPMDQGVISAMKHGYWTRFLNDLIEEDDKLAIYWEKMIMVHALCRVSEAWTAVKPGTLARPWMEILPALRNGSVNDMFCIENVNYTELISLLHRIDGFQNADEETVKEWLESNAGMPEFQHINEHFVHRMQIKSEQYASGVCDGNLETTNNQISHSTALKCMDIVLDYMSQWDFECSDIQAAIRIGNTIRENLKQSDEEAKATHFLLEK